MSLSLPSNVFGASLPYRFTLPIFPDIPITIDVQRLAVWEIYSASSLPSGLWTTFRHLRAGCSIALILILSAVLFCDSNCFSRSYKNYTFIAPMADIRITSVTETYQRRLNSKPTFLPRRSGAWHWAQTVFLISCLSYSFSANPRSASSPWRMWS